MRGWKITYREWATPWLPERNAGHVSFRGQQKGRYRPDAPHIELQTGWGCKHLTFLRREEGRSDK